MTTLNIEYPYRGPTPDTRGTLVDQQIYNVLGKKDTARGCGFGKRDLQFHYKTEAQAQEALDQLKLATSSWPVRVFAVILKEE